MPKPIIILLFFAAAIACNPPVVTQHPPLQPPHVAPGQIDTVICLKFSDHRKLPDSRFLISTMHIRLPEPGWPKNYDSILNYVKDLARPQGGNVIKIVYETIPFWRGHLAMDVQVFSLEEPSLSYYKATLDSAENAYKDSIKNMAIVRLRDVDDGAKRTIFFNGALMGRIHGIGQLGSRKPGHKTFVFNTEGVLRFKYWWFTSDSIHIVPGNEYNIEFYTLWHFRAVLTRWALRDKDYFETLYPPEGRLHPSYPKIP